MRESGKTLMKVAGWVFLPILILTMVLGYSGNADLARVGNSILVLAVPSCGLLLLVGFVLWISGRSSANGQESR